jgi:hypothetical protein
MVFASDADTPCAAESAGISAAISSASFLLLWSLYIIAGASGVPEWSHSNTVLEVPSIDIAAISRGWTRRLKVLITS